jgi:hypothetical protein
MSNKLFLMPSGIICNYECVADYTVFNITKKVTVKFSLCLSTRHSMKYWGCGV